MGIAPLLNSSLAISRGSVLSVSMRTGAPMAICNALAPIILARSNRVYSNGNFTFFDFDAVTITPLNEWGRRDLNSGNGVPNAAG